MLGDFMVRGTAIRPSDSPDEEFELYSIPAHDRGGPEIVIGSEVGSAKQLVVPGDVMISRIIPHIRRVRVVGFRKGRRQVASGEWIVLRGDGFDPNYLRHFLLSDGFHRPFMNTVAGVGGSLVRARPQHVKTIPLPLPRLDEQRRMAATLDHADALRTKRRQVLTHLDSLTQSIFHDMFGSADVDSTVGEVATVQGGLQVTSKRSALPVETPYLRVANVYRGRIDLSEVKQIRATPAEIDRTRLESGDLLFVEGHANPMEVGRVAVWRGDIAGCVHQNHLIRARLDSHRIRPTFAEHFLNTTRGASHFRRSGNTTSGLNTISAGTVRSAPIAVPPMELQQSFEERVQRFIDHRANVDRALAADDELFASLQSRAFRGDL